MTPVWYIQKAENENFLRWLQYEIEQNIKCPQCEALLCGLHAATCTFELRTRRVVNSLKDLALFAASEGTQGVNQFREDMAKSL